MSTGNPNPGNTIVKEEGVAVEDIQSWERKSFRERLGVSAHATQEEIKGAFRTLSSKYHPDKVSYDSTLRDNHSEIMKLLNEAYTELMGKGPRNRISAAPQATAEYDFQNDPSLTENQKEKIQHFIWDIRGMDPITLEQKLDRLSSGGIERNVLLRSIEPELLRDFANYIATWGMYNPQFIDQKMNRLISLGINRDSLTAVYNRSKS